MAKSKIKKPTSSSYKALEKAVETFRQLWIRQRMCSPLGNYRAHNAPNPSDFLCELELLVRRTYPDKPQVRKAFWDYVFAKGKVGQDGIERKIGTERWACTLGAAIEKLGLIPPKYFTHIIRTGAKDKSAVKDDLQKLEGIVQRYERLKREWKQKHGKHEAEPEIETLDSGIGESQTNTDESIYREPAVGALTDVVPVVQEGFDYHELEEPNAS